MEENREEVARVLRGGFSRGAVLEASKESGGSTPDQEKKPRTMAPCTSSTCENWEGGRAVGGKLGKKRIRAPLAYMGGKNWRWGRILRKSRSWVEHKRRICKMWELGKVVSVPSRAFAREGGRHLGGKGSSSIPQRGAKNVGTTDLKCRKGVH